MFTLHEARHSSGTYVNTVRKVLDSGQNEVPHLGRAERLEPHIATIRALVVSCEGNLVRVHEELPDVQRRGGCRIVGHDKPI